MTGIFDPVLWLLVVVAILALIFHGPLAVSMGLSSFVAGLPHGFAALSLPIPGGLPAAALLVLAGVALCMSIMMMAMAVWAYRSRSGSVGQAFLPVSARLLRR
jgi:hypothetical protein